MELLLCFFVLLLCFPVIADLQLLVFVVVVRVLLFSLC